jgi:hypothetical protein
VTHFKKVISALLICPPSDRGGKKRTVHEVLPPGELDPEVRDMFVTRWLNVHVDVRWFFLRDAEYVRFLFLPSDGGQKAYMISVQYSPLLRPNQTPMSPKIFSPFSRS